MERKKTILAVDDEEDLINMVKFQFAAKGYYIETAYDGVQGLERLKSITPDLIILDLNMPKMGGIEFYHKICGKDCKPQYPILVLTARANTEQLFREFDVDGFMTKPFDIENLINEAELIIAKNSRLRTDTLIPGPIKSKSVFIVENDQQAFNKIAVTFINAEYIVNSAKSGTAAIEKMVADTPCLALISLGLKDIPGDLLIYRLKRLSKTMDIHCILYTPKREERDHSVLSKIEEKAHVVKLVEYADPTELLDAVDQALKKLNG